MAGVAAAVLAAEEMEAAVDLAGLVGAAQEVVVLVEIGRPRVFLT